MGEIEWILFIINKSNPFEVDSVIQAKNSVILTYFEFSDFGHKVVTVYWCLSQMEWEFPPRRSHE